MTEKLLSHSKDGQRIFMTEIQEETYIESITDLLKDLIDDGYTGVFVSFQRPYQDLHRQFDEAGIDASAFHIVDAATMIEQDNPPESDDGVTYLGDDRKIDELARTIYSSVQEQDQAKRFIIIDSLTTISLYNPLSETMRLAEFLITTLEVEADETILVFNVAKDQRDREFIRDIAFKVDEVIALDD